MGLNGSKGADAVPQPSRRLVKLEAKLREKYGLESGGAQRCARLPSIAHC